MRYTRFFLPFTLAVVILAAFLSLRSPVLAQEEVIYHVWSKSGTCDSLLDLSGNVVDLVGYVGTIDPGEYYNYFLEQSQPDLGGNNSIEQWFTVCTLDVPDPSPEFEYAMYSYGTGGYRITTDYDVNFWDSSSSVVENGGSTVGGGGAGCLMNSGGITNTTIQTPTGGVRWGYKLHVYIFVNESFCSAPTYAKAGMRFRFEGEEEEELPYCFDGVEALDAPLNVPTGAAWIANGNVGWERFYVRYVFEDTVDSGALVGMGMWANDKLVSRRFYSDPSDPTDTYTFTVPNRTDPDGRNPSGVFDYDKYGYAAGPIADLMFDNYYGPVTLLSACVIEAHRPLTPSTWCTDGLELLEAPVPVEAYTGYWETTVYGLEYLHLTVRYVVENPVYPYPGLTDQMQAMPGLEYNLYWVEANLEGQQYITFTLPTTGVIKMLDNELLLEWFNYGVAVNIASICAIDAQDSMPQLTAEMCHLVNPDFVNGIGGWSTYGSVNWDYYEENGLVEEEDGGMVFQNAVQNRGTVWKMEVRARQLSGAGDTVEFGSNTTSLIYGGEQINEYELGYYYAVYEQDVFVEDGGWVQAAGEDARVDYVCLVDPDDFILTPTCIEPEWNPSGSGDPLLVYLIKFLADIQQYVGCIILRAIALAVNAITGFLRDILLRIPALPNPDDGVYSWLEWIGMFFARYFDWIGLNLSGLTDWIPTNAGELADFLNNMFMEFIFWLSEQLEFDPFWLLETLDAIWDEALLFWDEIQLEAGIEFEDLLLLLQNMANVMLVLVDGVREGVSGETIAYIGEDFEGVGAFIWEGVNFLNTAIQDTPLVGLNLVALAAITLSLSQWTVKKFLETLEVVA